CYWPWNTLKRAAKRPEATSPASRLSWPNFATPESPISPPCRTPTTRQTTRRSADLKPASQLEQQLERIDTGVVAVAELDRIGIVADRLHSCNCQRPSVAGREDWQEAGWRLGLRSLLATACAWASIAQLTHRVFSALTVAPLNHQAAIAAARKV